MPARALTVFRPLPALPELSAAELAQVAADMTEMHGRIYREARAAAALAFDITKDIVPTMPVGFRGCEYIG